MILVLLVAFIPLSLAADTACTNQGGHCQIDSTACSGTYHTGLCDGAANRRCCISADHNCIAQSGHCQIDTNACSGGHYVTGLCSGAANRRCCVSGTANACSALQKDLACQLLNSASVQSAHVHPSGVTDNAFAYNNLRDMCNGLKASRSSCQDRISGKTILSQGESIIQPNSFHSYSCNGCSAPGGRVCLSTDLLQYLVALKNRGKIIINELAGACHSCSSRHYSGLAVDLDDGARNAEYLSTCTAMGGWGQNEGNHIHCQFYDQPHPNGF